MLLDLVFHCPYWFPDREPIESSTDEKLENQSD